MDPVTLTLTEDQAAVLSVALGALIDRTGEVDLPRAMEASDHIATQRIEMLVERALIAHEVYDDLAKKMGAYL